MIKRDEHIYLKEINKDREKFLEDVSHLVRIVNMDFDNPHHPLFCCAGCIDNILVYDYNNNLIEKIEFNRLFAELEELRNARIDKESKTRKHIQERDEEIRKRKKNFKGDNTYDLLRTDEDIIDICNNGNFIRGIKI